MSLRRCWYRSLLISCSVSTRMGVLSGSSMEAEEPHQQEPHTARFIEQEKTEREKQERGDGRYNGR